MTVKTLLSKNTMFILMVIAAAASALLPHIWYPLFNASLGLKMELVFSLLFVVFAFGVMRNAKSARMGRLVWILTPVALWHPAVTLFVFAIWKLKGFAP